MVSLEENGIVLGIQLAIFEVLWPMENVSCIAYRLSEAELEVRFETSNGLSAEDRDVCERLMKEILEAAALHSTLPRSFITFARVGAERGEFQVLMSNEIAEDIARQHAPWRISSLRKDA